MKANQAPRKIIQVATAVSGDSDPDSLTVALCNDGTVWRSWNGKAWSQMDPIPQPSSHGAPLPLEQCKAPADQKLSGRHYCIIEESEWVKAGAGGYLELVVRVIDGEQKGRRFVERLHLDSPINREQQEQAYKRLADYCHLTGQIQITDSSQLHGIPFWVRLNGTEALTTGRLQEESRPGWFKPRGEPFTVEVLE